MLRSTLRLSRLWLLALTVALALPGCASPRPTMPADARASDDYDIVLLPTEDFPYERAVQLAKILGDDTGLRIRAVLPLGKNDWRPYPDGKQYDPRLLRQIALPAIAELTKSYGGSLYILLTTRDINNAYGRLGPGYVFDDSSPVDKVAVISVARMRIDAEGQQVSMETAASRLRKIALRTIALRYYERQPTTGDPRDLLYLTLMNQDALDRTLIDPSALRPPAIDASDNVIVIGNPRGGDTGEGRLMCAPPEPVDPRAKGHTTCAGSSTSPTAQVEALRAKPKEVSTAAVQQPDQLFLLKKAGFYVLGMPSNSLRLKIPAREQTQIRLDADKRNHFFLSDGRRVLGSGWFKHEDHFPGIELFWPTEQDRLAWKNRGLAGPTDVVFKKIGEWEVVFYDAPGMESGAPGSNLRALWVVQGEIRLDVVISAYGTDGSSSLRRLAASLLSSLVVEQESPVRHGGESIGDARKQSARRAR